MRKLATVALISLLLYGCTKELNKFSGDHTTAQIRGMWIVCFQSKQRVQPKTPPIIHTAACDCIVDKSRENFSSKDYKNNDNLTQFFKEKSIECDAEGMVNIEPVKHSPSTL